MRVCVCSLLLSFVRQGAQPCWSDAEQTMRNVPYLVAVDCAVAPPDKLVYHTLQLARHDVVTILVCSFLRLCFLIAFATTGKILVC